MSDWPPTLPQAPMHQGYAQREQTATIRSSMDYGPAKVRRRVTAAIQPINVSLVLDGTQKDTLIAFYSGPAPNGMAGGVLSFTWVDHLNNDAPVNYRFTSPIQWSSRGPDIWLAVLNLEILP